MAANQAPIFQLAPKGVDTAKSIANGDSTTKFVIYTAGADGGRVDSVMITASSSVAETLQFNIRSGATDYPLGEILIPIGSGTDGGTTPGVNGFDIVNMPYLQPGARLPLPANASLVVNAKVAVTDGTVNVVPMGGDYS